MAKNKHLKEGDNLYLPVPTDTASGDPVVVGAIPGVALIDEDEDGNATIDTRGAYDLEVVANDGSADTAVSEGDVLYFDSTDGNLNLDDAGDRFGYALEAVTSGATTTIPVKIGY